MSDAADQAPDRPSAPARPRADDWREAVASADLPPNLAAIVASLAGRSRLWRSEKLDLARELAAHFADGLAAGRTPEELTMDFGDPRTAAHLVRRAKKRARPRAYRAFIHTTQAIGIVLLAALIAYLLLAWRFFAAEPRVTRNYVAEHNEAVERIPENERAYELYLGAWALIPPKPDSVLNVWPDIAPEHPAYPDAIAYLERTAPALEIIHQAATRPRIGALYSQEHDPRYAAIIKARYPDAFTPEPDNPWIPKDNPPLVATLLPYLAEFRDHARLLAFDTHEAARRREPDRVARDLATMLGIADQAASEPTLISQLVGFAVHGLAARTAAQVIDSKPELLSDAQLRALSDRFGAFMDGRPRLDYTSERLMFDDLLQRTYSDDGAGNGHLTAAGLRQLHMYASLSSGHFDGIESAAQVALLPVVVADRASMLATFSDLLARVEAAAALPLWQHDALAEAEREIEAICADPVSRIRHLPVCISLPALIDSASTHERSAQLRDATRAGIAIELYKREHGAYPEALSDLVPAFLPAVPPDRFTGETLSYALIDGVPHLWSVGADRDDDAGRPPAAHPDQSHRWVPSAEVAALLADPQTAPMYDGDWLLWPVIYDPYEQDP